MRNKKSIPKPPSQFLSGYADYERTLGRLAASMRGIGDPLIAT